MIALKSTLFSWIKDIIIALLISIRKNKFDNENKTIIYTLVHCAYDLFN